MPLLQALEYIWLDGYEPVPSLRGKTKVVEFDDFPTLDELPLWGFDGSSTEQAEGSDSDCMLKPVAVFPDATRTNGALVMCEVMLPDVTPPRATRGRGLPMTPTRGSGSSRSTSSTRTAPRSVPGGRRLRRRRAGTTPGSATRTSAASRARSPTRTWSSALRPGSRTRASTQRSRRASGSSRSSRRAPGRRATRCGSRATSLCALASATGSTSTSIRSRSARVSTGTGPACIRTSRRSTCARSAARTTAALMAAFAAAQDEHIAVYGSENHLRLTRLHETQSIDTFSYGVADRGASIRVPHSFVANGYRGYLEDRRPNSQRRPVPGHRAARRDDPHGAAARDERRGAPRDRGRPGHGRSLTSEGRRPRRRRRTAPAVSCIGSRSACCLPLTGRLLAPTCYAPELPVPA